MFRKTTVVLCIVFIQLPVLAFVRALPVSRSKAKSFNAKDAKEGKDGPGEKEEDRGEV